MQRRRRGVAPAVADERSERAALPPRLFVLILGGASYGEMRCALEVGGGGKVAFGCTALQTPKQYVRTLQAAGGGYGEEAAEDEEVAPVMSGLLHF